VAEWGGVWRCRKNKAKTSNATAKQKKKDDKEEGKEKKEKFLEPKIKWQSSQAKQLLYEDVKDQRGWIQTDWTRTITRWPWRRSPDGLEGDISF
jgi:hypothetical protein